MGEDNVPIASPHFASYDYFQYSIQYEILGCLGMCDMYCEGCKATS